MFTSTTTFSLIMGFPRSMLVVVSLSRAFATVEHNMPPREITNYKNAIEALNHLQSNEQYLKNAVIKPKAETNLAEMAKFLKRTGLPLTKLDRLPIIHIAGTNGKGTTCAYSESILRSHGYKTGFYSSPHLVDVRERIRVNGKPMSKTEFAKHFWRMYDMLDKQKSYPGDMPIYFAYLTILAFHVFMENKVDVAIVEVGIGGEFDCTNVVRKTAVAGITPLDYDHTALLGHSMESIAWNKGGIMKEGCLAFTTVQPEGGLKILVERSVEKNCTLSIMNQNYYVAKNGSKIPFHVQKTNANLALAISEAFIEKDNIHNNKSDREFSIETAKKAIEDASWPGRYEIIETANIRFFLDGAHTLESITICANWFEDKTAKSSRKRVLIFNLTGDRDSQTFFKELSKLKFDTVIFTPNVGSEKDSADIVDVKLTTDDQLQRCEGYKQKWLDVEENAAKRTEDVKIFPSFSAAENFLGKDNEYDVLVTGSIHLIGAALSVLDPTLNGALKD